ncbi:MAG TPA: YeeE/YedE family protein [Polyangiales bacterium]
MLGALLSGLVFGVGLVLSGMTQPAKVIAFLDVTGAWDPSLAFVMAGAIAVYAPVYHLLRKRTVFTALDTHVSEPIDARLVVGAVIFGAGWGLGGFCPGPGFTALGGGAPQAFVFVAAMLAGMCGYRLFQRSRPEQDGAFSIPPPAASVASAAGAQSLAASRNDCA